MRLVIYTEHIQYIVCIVNVLYLQSLLFTLDQPAGQICVGAGQVAQSALQVAHFSEKSLIFVK